MKQVEPMLPIAVVVFMFFHCGVLAQSSTFTKEMPVLPQISESASFQESMDALAIVGEVVKPLILPPREPLPPPPAGASESDVKAWKKELIRRMEEPLLRIIYPPGTTEADYTERKVTFLLLQLVAQTMRRIPPRATCEALRSGSSEPVKAYSNRMLELFKKTLFLSSLLSNGDPADLSTTLLRRKRNEIVAELESLKVAYSGTESCPEAL